MSSTSELRGIDIVGTIGGLSVSLSLVPQVLKTYQTKSATDISYIYQAIYIFGLTFINAYAIAEGLWPVYGPALLEEVLIITLTIMKVVYDKQIDENNSSSSESKKLDTTNTDGNASEAKGSSSARNSSLAEFDAEARGNE